ncbi:DUF892 family protein, partial [Hyphomicrobium sp.]|uniref:DUF892 family protein n=1 Tax=Hyphomicrobium sp. TaxID=82 RepID=UPI0025C5538F
MQEFERVYRRTLGFIYDAEKQLVASLRPVGSRVDDRRLKDALREIETQSARQEKRIENIFRVLYLEPVGEASWATTALLREAWETSTRGDGAQGCAAALLAIKRYEITLYEALLRWSEQCHLVEVLADIRRSIAEELVQASVLSELAFEDLTADGCKLTVTERN